MNIRTAGPNLGRVKRVKRGLGSLFRRHDLDHHGPPVLAPFVDGLVHLTLGIVRVNALRFERLLIVELLGAVVRTEVVLSVSPEVETCLE